MGPSVTEEAPGMTPAQGLKQLRETCETLVAMLVKQVENGFTVTIEISYIDPDTRSVQGVETRNMIASSPNDAGMALRRVTGECSEWRSDAQPSLFNPIEAVGPCLRPEMQTLTVGDVKQMAAQYAGRERQKRHPDLQDAEKNKFSADNNPYNPPKPRQQ